MKKEDRQKYTDGAAERERDRAGTGRGRELALRKALKLFSDPLPLQWDHVCLPVGCYFQTKRQILKFYFALEIELLHSSVAMTSLGELLAFTMFRMSALEELLRDHRSNFTFKVVEKGPSAGSMSFTGLVLSGGPRTRSQSS